MEQLQQLESCFREQYENYKRLQQLTILQQDAIEKNDIDHLEKLIEDKQQLIRIIDIKQALIEEKKQVLSRALGVQSVSLSVLEKIMPEGELIALKHILKQLQALMEGLMTMENQNEALLRGQMEKVKKEINHVQVGKRAMNSYGQTYSPDAFYFDKKK